MKDKVFAYLSQYCIKIDETLDLLTILYYNI